MATEDVMEFLEIKRKCFNNEISEFTDLHDPIVLNGCDAKYLFPYPTILPYSWPFKTNEYNKEEFITTFTNNPIGCLINNILTIPGVMIAGGSVARLFNRDNHSLKDYDIFLYGEDFEEKINTILKYIKQRFEKRADTKFSMNPGLIEIDTYLGIFQIILRKYQSRAHILHSFDIGASQIGFDGKNFYITSLGIYAYKYKINIVFKLYNNKRCNKYVSRGFGVMLPFLNKLSNDDKLFLNFADVNMIDKELHIKQLKYNCQMLSEDNDDRNNEIDYYYDGKPNEVWVSIRLMIESLLNKDVFDKLTKKDMQFCEKNADSIPIDDDLMNRLDSAKNVAIFFDLKKVYDYIHYMFYFNLKNYSSFNEICVYNFELFKKLLTKEEFISFYTDSCDEQYFENFYDIIILPKLNKYILQFIPYDQEQNMFVHTTFNEDFSIDVIAQTYGDNFIDTPEKNDPQLVLQTIYNDDESSDNEDSIASEICCLCKLGIDSNEENICRLKCHKSHIFHMFETKKCMGIMSWLTKDTLATCPICRQNQNEKKGKIKCL